MKRVLALALVVALVGLGTPLPVFAGNPNALKGSIAGIAMDNTGVTLPNYLVRCRNVTTGTVLATQMTKANGAFSFANLEPGAKVLELVDNSGRVVGVTSAVVLNAGQMIVTGVLLTATAAGAAPPAGKKGAAGFFTSKWGIILLAGATAGIAAGVIASGGDGSPSK